MNFAYILVTTEPTRTIHKFTRNQKKTDKPSLSEPITERVYR